MLTDADLEAIATETLLLLGKKPTPLETVKCRLFAAKAVYDVLEADEQRAVREFAEKIGIVILIKGAT